MSKNRPNTIDFSNGLKNADKNKVNRVIDEIQYTLTHSNEQKEFDFELPKKETIEQSLTYKEEMKKIKDLLNKNKRKSP